MCSLIADMYVFVAAVCDLNAVSTFPPGAPALSIDIDNQIYT